MSKSSDRDQAKHIAHEIARRGNLLEHLENTLVHDAVEFIASSSPDKVDEREDAYRQIRAVRQVCGKIREMSSEVLRESRPEMSVVGNEIDRSRAQIVKE